jgi:hypothetical protein
MRLPAAERELSHSPRIFHGGCTVCLNIGSELPKLYCAILGLNRYLYNYSDACLTSAKKPLSWRHAKQYPLD